MVREVSVGITFMASDPRFSEDQRVYLMCEAADMYIKEEDNRKLARGDLEGMITTDNKYHHLINFSGILYEAAVECEFGKTDVAFLVGEPHRGAMVLETYVEDDRPPTFH